MAETYLRDGEAIYERSFAIIRAEADLSRFAAEEADVAVRMIHACGQVEAARHIVFGDGSSRRRARRCDAARRSCATPKWSRTASRARGCRRGNEVICTLNDPARAGARRKGCARRARRRRSICGATGSPAPWSPSAMRRRRCFACSKCSMPARRSPAAILGIPVGFVGAAESKEALAANPRGVPYLIVRGRIGGSAMTAAAVNALARPGL